MVEHRKSTAMDFSAFNTQRNTKAVMHREQRVGALPRTTRSYKRNGWVMAATPAAYQKGYAATAGAEHTCTKRWECWQLLQLPRAERFRMKVVGPPKDASRKGGRVLAVVVAAYTKRYAATTVTGYTWLQKEVGVLAGADAACRKRWDELVGPKDTCGKGWCLQLLHTSLCIHR